MRGSSLSCCGRFCSWWSRAEADSGAASGAHWLSSARALGARAMLVARTYHQSICFLFVLLLFSPLRLLLAPPLLVVSYFEAAAAAGRFAICNRSINVESIPLAPIWLLSCARSEVREGQAESRARAQMLLGEACQFATSCCRLRHAQLVAALAVVVVVVARQNGGRADIMDYACSSRRGCTRNARPTFQVQPPPGFQPAPASALATTSAS